MRNRVQCSVQEPVRDRWTDKTTDEKDANDGQTLTAITILCDAPLSPGGAPISADK